MWIKNISVKMTNKIDVQNSLRRNPIGSQAVPVFSGQNS